MEIGTVLCPVDFSEASRAALRAAACYVRQFHARLQVLFVEDPLLAAAAAEMSVPAPDLTGELKRFVSDTGNDVLTTATLAVVTGTDVASAIVTLADRERARLIVMGAHGLTGIPKAFFGSTTARVLKKTTTPVLIVPPTVEPDQQSRGARAHSRPH